MGNNFTKEFQEKQIITLIVNEFIRKTYLIFAILLFVLFSVNAQFVHPGLWHKKSDLDRMKYMVEAKIDPWYTSFNTLKANSKSNYNYTVRKDPKDNTLSRENPSHQRYQYEDDAIAAYQNSLMWYITGDERHAKKSIEILNAWSSLVNFYGGGTEPLCAGLYGAPLINAAEIIKSTYNGWAAADIQKFKDMLVYPGYSNTTIPQADINNDNVTFYWRTFMGDPGRHGNQGLLAWRTVMCIGVFCDNEIIYDRALRQIQGLPHRPDDIPYPSGPAIVGTTPTSNSNIYFNEYTPISPYRETTIPDYGFDDQIQHYIYDNGQCQESSRDQIHSFLGLGAVVEMMEMAWNQGTDIYSYLDNRILLGLEFTTKYNLSAFKPYPDQPIPWEPENFYQYQTRCGRWQSLKINPWVGSDLTRNSRGEGGILRPAFEMPVAHFTVRKDKKEEAKWITRARDYAETTIGYEQGNGTDSPGWGGLTYRRPEGCAGDPISGFSSGVPIFKMNLVPCTIEAENFDFYSANGEGNTYHDLSKSNTGGKYRTNVAVDIETCSEGGYNLTSIENGEWLTYTVSVPTTGLYTVKARYASSNANGKIKLSFGGIEKTSEVSVPFGTVHSNGFSDWKDLTIATDIMLTKGVQALKVKFSGASNAFILNNIKIENGTSTSCANSLPAVTPYYRIEPGINYSYYQGTWDQLPNFDLLTPAKTGLVKAIDQTAGSGTDNFGLVFTGWINVPISGTYSFFTTSDAGSRLIIDGKLIVNNDGLHNAVEKSGEVCLDEGFHQIKVEYFEKTDAKELSVKFAGPGISKRTIENLYAVSPCENIGLNVPPDIVPGISYNYYEGSWSFLPDFKTLTSLKTGTANRIDLTPRIKTDNFGLVFEGYIKLENDGEYNFYTTSDDGSRLWIDGKKVVDNDGTHSAIEKSGSICLGAGYHHLKVEYFDKTGSSDILMVLYDGPGFSKRMISELYYSPGKPTGSKLLENEQGFKVYPNPVSNIVTIELPSETLPASQSKIELYNYEGSKISEYILKQSRSLNIDLSGLRPGVYFLVYGDNSSRIGKPIIKQ